MDNFDYKKYLAEGRLLKENTVEYLIDKYGQKMIDFTIKVDQLTGDEVNDIEYLEDRIQTHLEEPAIMKKYLAEGRLLKEEVDVLGDEFTQEIQDDMKMYYKMDVDMDAIKEWVNMYYIGYNSEYDEGPGDVDYEGNEFGSEDYESEKKELVFDTAEREDFYMHLNPEADSTFPNLSEGKLLKENAPGYDTRKSGEALPTSESIKAAYEAKNNIKENDTNSPFKAMGQIFDIIRQNDMDAEDVLEEIGQEFNIAFEFGRAGGLQPK